MAYMNGVSVYDDFEWDFSLNKILKDHFNISQKGKK